MEEEASLKGELPKELQDIYTQYETSGKDAVSPEEREIALKVWDIYKTTKLPESEEYQRYDRSSTDLIDRYSKIFERSLSTDDAIIASDKKLLDNANYVNMLHGWVRTLNHMDEISRLQKISDINMRAGITVIGVSKILSGFTSNSNNVDFYHKPDLKISHSEMMYILNIIQEVFRKSP